MVVSRRTLLSTVAAGTAASFLIDIDPSPAGAASPAGDVVGNLGNGQPAALFSSYDQQTVDTHFGWMKTYGIDTAAHRPPGPLIAVDLARSATARTL